MDEFNRDAELEQMLGKLEEGFPPEGIMEDYAAGVRSKIKAREHFLAVAVPITTAVVSISVILILLAVFGLPHSRESRRLAPLLNPGIFSEAVPEQKTAIAGRTDAVSAAEVSREIKILQALGEDPTEAIASTMDTDQLAKEMNYWDEVATQSYKQTAPSATVGKI